MPNGKYYEYQIKRAALEDSIIFDDMDEFEYARESLDIDLKYEPYILDQTINTEIANKQHGINDAE